MSGRPPLCQECNQRKPKAKVSRIVRGEEQSVWACKPCAMNVQSKWEEERRALQASRSSRQERGDDGEFKPAPVGVSLPQPIVAPASESPPAVASPSHTLARSPPAQQDEYVAIPSNFGVENDTDQGPAASPRQENPGPGPPPTGLPPPPRPVNAGGPPLPPPAALPPPVVSPRNNDNGMVSPGRTGPPPPAVSPRNGPPPPVSPRNNLGANGQPQKMAKPPRPGPDIPPNSTPSGSLKPQKPPRPGTVKGTLKSDSASSSTSAVATSPRGNDEIASIPAQLISPRKSAHESAVGSPPAKPAGSRPLPPNSKPAPSPPVPRSAPIALPQSSPMKKNATPNNAHGSPTAASTSPAAQAPRASGKICQKCRRMAPDGRWASANQFLCSQCAAEPGGGSVTRGGPAQKKPEAAQGDLTQRVVDSMRNQLWYRTDVNSRSAAESILSSQGPGAFIVRPSSQPNALAISHYDRQHGIGHQLLCYHPSAKYGAGFGFSISPDKAAPVLPTVEDLLRSMDFPRACICGWGIPTADAMDIMQRAIAKFERGAASSVSTAATAGPGKHPFAGFASSPDTSKRMNGGGAAAHMSQRQHHHFQPQQHQQQHQQQPQQHQQQLQQHQQQPKPQPQQQNVSGGFDNNGVLRPEPGIMFRSDLNRSNAESLVRPMAPGSFVVRPSSQPGRLTVTYKEYPTGMLAHTNLFYTPQGWHTQGSDVKKLSVGALLQSLPYGLNLPKPAASSSPGHQIQQQQQQQQEQSDQIYAAAPHREAPSISRVADANIVELDMDMDMDLPSSPPITMGISASASGQQPPLASEPATPTMHSRKGPAVIVLCKAWARGDFDSPEEGEIGFKKGDIVDVLEQSQSDWWRVRLNGQIGFAPANGLEELDDNDPRLKQPRGAAGGRRNVPQNAANVAAAAARANPDAQRRHQTLMARKSLRNIEAGSKASRASRHTGTLATTASSPSLVSSAGGMIEGTNYGALPKQGTPPRLPGATGAMLRTSASARAPATGSRDTYASSAGAAVLAAARRSAATAATGGSGGGGRGRGGASRGRGGGRGGAPAGRASGSMMSFPEVNHKTNEADPDISPLEDDPFGDISADLDAINALMGDVDEMAADNVVDDSGGGGAEPAPGTTTITDDDFNFDLGVDLDLDFNNI